MTIAPAGITALDFRQGDEDYAPDLRPRSCSEPSVSLLHIPMENDPETVKAALAGFFAA
jgi:hypothetical protein